ncbi:MAG: chemotaxis response regulator protein-glutamate methylesterase [Pseudomonadota bacterium]
MKSPESSFEPIRVMVVDDSAIIRGLITKALEKDSEISIVSSAFNGAIAIDNIKKIQADIILLDIEMPEVDGLTALPKLLALSPSSRIIMVSSITAHNAEASIKAMQLGASDYITKPTARNNQDDLERFYYELIQKVKSLALRRKKTDTAKEEVKVADVKATSLPEIKPTLTPIIAYPKYPVKAIAIGCSTGGPQALAKLFADIASAKSIMQPIFITQHMPATFTTILAKHIEQISGRKCVEGADGDIVKNGTIYVAPGDYHLTPMKENENIVIRINKDPQVNFCRPAVDPMFNALSAIYGSNLLAVILTGMGSDGLGGAKNVVKTGGTLISQDENSSVVWGMPRAVAENKLSSAILPLDEIAPYIIRVCS